MKVHRFDALSFVAGLFITGIGLAFLLLPEADDIIDFVTNAGSWFWPVVFIAIGVAILAPLASRNRDSEEPDEPETTEMLG
jgi:hypothetical protein